MEVVNKKVQKVNEILTSKLKESKLMPYLKVRVTELVSHIDFDEKVELLGRIPFSLSEEFNKFKESVLEALSKEENAYFADCTIKECFKVVKGLTVGESFESFSVYDTEGNSVEIKPENKALALFFWLSFSMASLHPMANNMKLAAEITNGNLEILGISGDSDREKWLTMLRNNKWDKIKQFCKDSIEEEMGCNGVPCLVLVSSEGKVEFLGHPNELDLKATLKGYDSKETNPIVRQVEMDESARNEHTRLKSKEELQEMSKNIRTSLHEVTGTVNAEFILKTEITFSNNETVVKAVPLILGTMSKPEYQIILNERQKITKKWNLDGIELKVKLLQ